MSVQSNFFSQQFFPRANLKPLSASKATDDAAAEGDALKHVAARLFDVPVERLDKLPGWLLEPGYLLETLAHPEPSLGARVAVTRKMVQTIDDLFARDLPENGQWLQHHVLKEILPQEALPRWIDFLFNRGGMALRYRLLDELAQRRIHHRPVVQVDDPQLAWLHRYFMERVYPILTPLAVDPGHPFPFISHGSINLLVELRNAEDDADRSFFARVKVPSATRSWIQLPDLAPRPRHRRYQASAGSTQIAIPATSTDFVWSADLVRFFIHHLFPSMPVRRVYLFRVIRGEEPLPGFGSTTSHSVGTENHMRRTDRRSVVRLDVERRMEAHVLTWLCEHLHIPGYAVARHDYLGDWLSTLQMPQTIIDGEHQPKLDQDEQVNEQVSVKN